MSAGLGGTGLVADDLYLLAHHDVTGRPLLQPRPLSIGLAGGLLAELMLGGSISLRHDGAVTAHRTWPADDLGTSCPGSDSRRIWNLTLFEEWLLFLARTTAGDVAGRLERAGYLRHAVSRVPFRPGRWVPVDPDWAFTPVVRVRAALNRPGRWSARRPPWPGWPSPAVLASGWISTRSPPAARSATRSAGSAPDCAG